MESPSCQVLFLLRVERILGGLVVFEAVPFQYLRHILVHSSDVALLGDTVPKIVACPAECQEVFRLLVRDIFIAHMMDTKP